MNENFSLLRHLNVQVASVSQSAAKPSSSANEGNEKWVPYRAWSPASRPPVTGDADYTHSGRPASSPLQQQPRLRPTRYADPTGEVIRAKDKGQPVEYIVYDSKVPSIHGVNRQLAEEKRREAEEQAARDREAATSVQLYFRNADKSADEEHRRRLLDELRRCNMEQAQRRREEARRDERRRMEREAEHLRAIEAAEAKRSEAEHRQKLANQLAVREAAEEAIAVRRRREEKARQEASVDYMSFMPGSGSHIGGAIPARMLRDQRLADENLRLAEERVRRRREEADQERKDAQRANEAALQAMQADNERRLQERERSRRAFEQYAVEAADRRREAQEAAERERLQGAVVLAFASDDAELAERRAEQFRADQEVNRRLAEQRRAREREEEEHDRHYAEQQFVQGRLAAERERERERAKRREQQAAMREAAERGIREREARRAEIEEKADVPVYFADKQDEREKQREQQQRQHAADLERQIEQKRQERAENARREREEARAYVEQAQRASASEEQRRKEKDQQQRASLQRDLERQIASKSQERKAAAALRGQPEFGVAPAPEQRVLYRCPVTHELLPASEFDFHGVRQKR